MKKIRITPFFVTLLALAWIETGRCEALRLEGLTVTPHLQSHEMRYRRAADFSLGARTQLFIRNVSDSPLPLEPDTGIHLRDRTPKELLEADEWTLNGKHQEWGIDNNLTEVKT